VEVYGTSARDIRRRDALSRGPVFLPVLSSLGSVVADIPDFCGELVAAITKE